MTWLVQVKGNSQPDSENAQIGNEGRVVCAFCVDFGERMKREDSDSSSRGNSTTRVLVGYSFLEHIPLNKNTCVRHPEFKNWLRKESPGKFWVFFDQTGWFEETLDNT